jgi:hypothetical protein
VSKLIINQKPTKMKMKIITTLLIAAFAFIVISCGEKKEKVVEDTIEFVQFNDAEVSFLKNLASLCGQSFAGKQTYSKDGRDSWADKKLVMHVTVCEEDKVHIPFHVDENKSRTWMFMFADGKLRFRHDHRHEDGTPEDQTLYGGYSDGKGSDIAQCFPEDEYTKELLKDGLKRQWNVSLNEDMSKFIYDLIIDDIIVFTAEFDLTKPL